MFQHPYDQKKLSVMLNIFMIFLVITSITLTIIESIPSIMTPELARLFLSIHTAILIAFFGEFLYRIWRAPEENRRYTPTNARIRFLLHPLTIIDLAVIAPLFVMLWTHDLHDADFVLLRLLRFTSMLNIFRFYRNSQLLSVLRRFGKNIWYEIMIFLLLTLQLMLVSGVLFYLAEHGHNPAVNNILDGIWWSVVTMATIGYGDIYPYTALGRVLGGIVGLFGIGLIALPAGIMATGFSQALKEDRHIKELEENVEEIEEDTDDMNKRLARIEKILREKL